MTRALPRLADLLERELPAYLLVGPEGVLDGLRDEVVGASRGQRASAEVRIVRGDRCETKMSVFREFAAALQFPWYFGNNWDAFDECLTDLSEVQPPRTLVLISHIEEVLAHDDESFRTLIDIVRGAVAVGLRVVFQGSTSSAAERLAVAGFPVEPVYV